MPDREFLQSYPLYRKFASAIPRTVDQLSQPTINMACQACDSNQTFEMANSYGETFAYSNYPSAGEVVCAKYVCVGCRKYRRYFIILLSGNLDWLMKVGQHPAWEVRGDLQIEKLLGQHKDYLRRGLVSESQGYGIGAFAYYRRIVEEIIDGLLLGIGDLLSEDEQVKYKAALAQSAKTRVAAEKIELVKDLLPPILRPQGMNPLSTLHKTLSEGLHASNDERCLQLAEVVRQVLIFLATQVAVSTNAGATFTANMRSLLDGKK